MAQKTPVELKLNCGNKFCLTVAALFSTYRGTRKKFQHMGFLRSHRLLICGIFSKSFRHSASVSLSRKIRIQFTASHSMD